MKGLIPYILYAISVFFIGMFMVQLAWSDIDTLEGLSIDTNSTIEGTSGLDTIEGSGVSGGGGCDDCSGSLAMAIHFEDNSGSDLETGTPCGCTDGTDTTYSMTGGSSHSSTQASDGTYSALCDGEDDAVEIDSTGLAASISSVGTWCADYYRNSGGLAWAFEMPIHGRIYDGAGADDNYLYISYGTESFTGTDTFADATWTRICFSWDESQGAGADRLCTKVGANGWECSTNRTLTDPTLDATLYIAGGDWQYGRGYFDIVKLYSTYQAE